LLREPGSAAVAIRSVVDRHLVFRAGLSAGFHCG
jgi:hypothetical protein